VAERHRTGRSIAFLEREQRGMHSRGQRPPRLLHQLPRDAPLLQRLAARPPQGCLVHALPRRTNRARTGHSQVPRGRPLAAKTFARLGGGAANINGHKQVECANCHDMGQMGCSACHASRHQRSVNRGTNCPLCHKPGVSFVFTHPPRDLCEECHEAPSDHKQAQNRSVRGCPGCHRRPEVTWVAYHPGPTKPCESCHRTPSDHNGLAMSRSCVACHKRAGVSWSAAVH
jgi:hypothetical protein